MYTFKTESYRLEKAANEIFELTQHGWRIISVSADAANHNDIVVVYRKEITNN